MFLRLLTLWLIVSGSKAILQDEILLLYGKEQFKNIFQENVEEIEYELISPIQSDISGTTVHKAKRGIDHPDEAFFSLNAFGEKFQLLVHKINDVIADDAEFTSRNEDGSISHINTEGLRNCYYSGHLISHENTPVAISTCNGLNGLISTRNEDYLIHSLPDTIRSKRNSDEPDHVIFKRSRNSPIGCGVDGRKEQLKRLKPLRMSRQAQNALNAKRLTVETALFFDLDIYNFYKRNYPQDTDNQIIKLFLAIMNAVQQLYNDPSLTDKHVSFVVIKMEFFKTRQVGFKIDPDAHIYLAEFCAWQEKKNILNDNDPRHWDHAFMFTGIDLYILPNKDGANGVGSVAGMCLPDESCTLCNGRGFVAVFTTAHECGHNFGMQHDSEGNTCTLPANFMMSGGEHVRPWSRCSREYFNEYLSYSHSTCLLDERKATPELDHERNNNVWLGQCFDMDQQCEISQGPGFTKDPNASMDESCSNYLFCVDSNGNPGREASHTAYQGSPCGNGKWCYDRKCVPKPQGVKELPVGKWTEYVLTSPCVSPCAQNGVGLSSFARNCVHPTNKNLFAKCEGPKFKPEDKCDDSKVCRVKRSVKEVAGDVCRKYRNQGATGEGHQATEDTSKGCWVWCKKSGGDDWPAEPFPNGVPCGDYKGKYCVRAECKQF